MLKRQSQTPPVQSNFTPQNSNALGRLSGSAAAANSIDLQQDAILGAFLLSSTLSAAALAVLNDINAISGTGYSGPASPLPTSTGDAVSGDANFQTTVTADTSNVSSGAPFALTEHASGDSGQNVADTGINVGVLPNTFNDLGSATQHLVDGARPPISDIQTQDELSSGGTDEVQTAHSVIHGAGMAFYPAGNADQNFASGALVANIANVQGAAPNSLGTAFITGLPAPTEVAITTAGMTSVALLDNPALGTAIAIPASYDWQGFAVSGSQTSTSQSGTGSSVVAVTSGGITIDLIFDTAAMAAPASFRTGIEQAASLIAASDF